MKKVSILPKSTLFTDMIMKSKEFLLRPWKKEDSTSLAEFANNFHIWNNARDSFPYPYTEKDAQSYIELTWQNESIRDFAIVMDGKAVGGIGYVPQYDVERISAEIGYWIGEPYWNKGFMTSLVSSFVDRIFETTDILRLYATVFEYNIPSMKVLEKNNFRKVGILEKAAVKNNRIIDLHYFELIKDNWDSKLRNKQ